MNEYEKMISGRLYNPLDANLDKIHVRGLSLCQKLNKVNIKRIKHKTKLLNKLIPSSKGNNFYVFTPFYCEYGINIHVGKDCFANYGCTLLDVAPINLGNSVWMGANVTIATPMHPKLAEERINNNYPDGYHDLEYAKPVTIKDNVWIASCTTICGGVTIGENSIVAAGSVVTKDMPSNCLIGGVPAKVIRVLSEEDRIDVWNTYINEKTAFSR